MTKEEVLAKIEALAVNAADQYPNPIYSREFADVLIKDLKEEWKDG